MPSFKMCAQDALYHADCLCQLYRDAQKSRIGKEVNENDRKLHGLAFFKVISYIDEALQTSDDETIPIFKLSDLTKYYSGCIVRASFTILIHLLA